VVAWYVSANRDEDVCPEPHRFDVGRSPNDHIAFGARPGDRGSAPGTLLAIVRFRRGRSPAR
jgi:cytochrome P450